MGQSKIIATLSGLFFLLIFSFQNCTVYTSSGREYIEEEGLALARAECLDDMTQVGCEVSFNQSKAKLTGDIAPLENESCAQYLDNSAVSNLSGNGEVQQRSFADLSADAVKCMYGIENASMEVDHLICKVSGSYIEEVNFPKEELVSIYNSSLGEAYEKLSANEDESCALIAPKVGILGAECCVSGNNKEKRDKFLQDISMEMIENLR